MQKPCYRVRDNEAGVSEVVGTLLILAMTVVLFATIILWVSNIPTPQATTKLDMDAAYAPIFLSGNGANITIRHKGGEDLYLTDVRIYITVTRSGIPSTTVLKVKGTYTSGPLSGKPYGLVDGRDSYWNIGERWQWSNYSTLPTDTITGIVVDLVRNTVLWSGDVLGAPGTHPPIFLDKWADRDWGTPTADTPYTGTAFHILARVTDADNDLAAVTGTLTIYFGTPSSCQTPQAMYDDGTNGDNVAGDGIWTLYRTCMDSPSLTWDGSIVLFNATDAKGHYTTSRLILHVVANPNGNGGGGTSNESGRLPNLRYNGLQGFNIFNGTQWTTNEFAALATHNFKANEQVVVVVGSLLLKDSRGQNQFVLSDPFSGIPADPAVYGTSKAVTFTTRPSNNQAFTFYKFVNGYNVFVYKFDLNNPSTVGTNYFTNPSHPPYYFFGQYPLSMTILDSTGAQFVASDAINVTDLNGNKRAFPVVTTFKDSVFTYKGTSFRSTDTIYVQVSMLTVDGGANPNANLVFGNIVIRDFRGGTQVFKAPINGRLANPPLCPVTGACTAAGQNIFTVVSPTSYRFAINLSRADQDSWVDGVQTYSLTLASIDDFDEQYSNLAVSIDVIAPLYKLDLVIGSGDAQSPAWGTHDFSYVYTAVNGLDRWQKGRLLSGDKLTPPGYTQAVKFFDFDRDGDLDIITSVVNWGSNGNSVLFLFRQDLDSFGNPVYTRFPVGTQSTVVCKDIATGDLTADGNPEIVCGGSDGKVWYYKNDGAWTRVEVDGNTARGAVNAVDIGDLDGDGDNDIAVGRETATAQVTYYLNLDGQGGFTNNPVTDFWFAESETTATGTAVPPGYIDTITANDVRESVQEGTVDEPSVSGATVNGGFDLTTASWTFYPWETASATGDRDTGGNPGGYVFVRMPPTTNPFKVSGYWVQAFDVSGAGPWNVTINLDYWFRTKGDRFSSLTLYVFVDQSAAATDPGPDPAKAVWSKTLLTPASWTGVTPPIRADSKIIGQGRYFLKVVAQTLFTSGGTGSTPTIAGFDNVDLTWSSTAGPVSEVKHYWRLQQLPNRPNTQFTLHVEGLRPTNAEGDDFTFSYAVDTSPSPPGATPPADATFTTASSSRKRATYPPTRLRSRQPSSRNSCGSSSRTQTGLWETPPTTRSPWTRCSSKR